MRYFLSDPSMIAKIYLLSFYLPVVKFTNCSTSLNPTTIVFNINVDFSQLGQVHHYKRFFDLRDIRQAFVVVTAASDAYMSSKFLGTDDGSLDVRLVERFEYESRFRHGLCQVPEILSCRLKDFAEHGNVFGRSEKRTFEWERNMRVFMETVYELILEGS